MSGSGLASRAPIRMTTLNPASATEDEMNTYTMRYRPAGFGTLPRDIRWDYVAMPTIFGLCGRRDLPSSNRTFGVIQTDRPLTPDELETFEIVPCEVAS